MFRHYESTHDQLWTQVNDTLPRILEQPAVKRVVKLSFPMTLKAWPEKPKTLYMTVREPVHEMSM